jgi:hypothetical protein
MLYLNTYTMSNEPCVHAQAAAIGVQKLHVQASRTPQATSQPVKHLLLTFVIDQAAVCCSAAAHRQLEHHCV